MLFKSVLVTGCNKGIGLEFVKQLAGKCEHVFATYRTLSSELSQLVEKHGNITLLKVEITDEDDIKQAVKKVSDIVKDDGLTCLVNNAGMVNYEQSCIEKVTSDMLLQLYQVITVGPAMMVKAALPLLRLSANNTKITGGSDRPTTIINISEKTASFDDNRSGKLYGSRLSKVALNMLTKNLSIELKNDGIVAVAVSPSWVKTDTGGPNAVLTTDESVSSMLKVFENLTLDDSGRFLNYNGDGIPW